MLLYLCCVSLNIFNDKTLRFDVKNGIERHIPSLLKLLGNQNISWNSINKGLDKHITKLHSELTESKEEEITKGVTFYSFLIGNEVNRKETAPMFSFFNNLFDELYNRLDQKELLHLHKMIKFVLTNYDYRYLNFIGELAVLNTYKSTNKYFLLNIEERVYSQNRVKADLFLKRKDDNLEFLVEIVNIHLEGKQIINREQIVERIKQKILEKINCTFFTSPKKSIYIQPVLWFESLKQIEITANIYKNSEIHFYNVFIPMCYLTYKLNDNYEHRFEYVNTILED